MGTPQHLDQQRLGRLVIGLLSLMVAVGYLVGAAGMPRGDLASPGPGMYPLGVGVLWIVASLVVAGEALLTSQDAGTVDLPQGYERRQALIFLGTLVAFIVVLPFLGFVYSAPLYVIASLKFLGGLSWSRSAAYGLLMGITVTLLFGQLLALPLPAAS